MIRFARAGDRPAIAAVVERAFGQPDEAELVARLRESGDVMFELVAAQDGEVAGHLMFSRLWADSQNLYAALAPVAVAPERQRTGVGSALIRASFAQAQPSPRKT